MAINSNYKLMLDADINRLLDTMNGYLDNYNSENIGSKARQIVDLIFDKSQIYVPEDTGATKNSWFEEIEIDKSGVLIIFGYDKNNELEYLPLIHAGFTTAGPINFRKKTAKPRFFARAIEETIPEAKKILGVNLNVQS